MDNNFYYRNGIVPYYETVAIYSIPAILLGIICEKTIAYLQKKYELNPVVAIILQLVFVTLILYIIEMHISLPFGSNWQSITPGLFFVSIFFGLQVSLYNNIFLLAT
jgi:hypothetical protein